MCLGFSELEPFDVFGFGESVYRHHSSHSEVEDRLHFFLEECDNLQASLCLDIKPSKFWKVVNCLLLKKRFCFLRIFQLSLTAFLSGLICKVVSHDLHHVTQGGAWPTGNPGLVCLVMASPVYVTDLYDFFPMTVLVRYTGEKTVSWEVNNCKKN